mmetsp:Transcript_13553/g.42663  ORF Transcript_13553/g.42663 Transcript_13553/m.42663 type:complete len:227 (+) Transcript_13553:240-920(+)
MRVDAFDRAASPSILRARAAANSSATSCLRVACVALARAAFSSVLCSAYCARSRASASSRRLARCAATAVAYPSTSPASRSARAASVTIASATSTHRSTSFSTVARLFSRSCRPRLVSWPVRMAARSAATWCSSSAIMDRTLSGDETTCACMRVSSLRAPARRCLSSDEVLDISASAALTRRMSVCRAACVLFAATRRSCSDCTAFSSSATRSRSRDELDLAAVSF